MMDDKASVAIFMGLFSQVLSEKGHRQEGAEGGEIHPFHHLSLGWGRNQNFGQKNPKKNKQIKQTLTNDCCS